MLQHRLASKEALDGNSQALDRGHGEGADNGADGEVDEDVVLAVTRGQAEDQEEAESQEDSSISQETCRRERKTQNSSGGAQGEVCIVGKHGWLRTRLLQLGSHSLQSGDLLVLWGVDDHHSAAHQAQQAAQLSQQVEPFSEQIGGQNGTARDRETSVLCTPLKKEQQL